MVDIPLLRKRAAELSAGKISNHGGAICLNAALDEIEELRARVECITEGFNLLRDTMEERTARHARALKQIREEATPTTCPDCGLGPCTEDPTSVTAATPRCYRKGYCGEPGEMSRPQVVCIVGGQPYPLWDEVQMRVRETPAL